MKQDFPQFGIAFYADCLAKPGTLITIHYGEKKVV